MSDQKGPIEARYSVLTTVRDPYLQRARSCAYYTIPSLMPEDTTSRGNETFRTPHQSLGARGLNNLAAKLLLTLFPPNTAPFRMQIGDYDMEKVAQQEGQRATFEEAFAKIERQVQVDIETSRNSRPKIVYGIMQALLSGSVCFQQLNKGYRVYRLDSFVCTTDGAGEDTEIITAEQIDPSTLTTEQLESYGLQDDPKAPLDRSGWPWLYTQIKRGPSRWTWKQELKGVEVDGSQGSSALDECPWWITRPFQQDGEDYGRSFVEHYLGELISLEGLSKAMVDGAAAAAKVVYLHRPGAQTSIRQFKNAANLDLVPGEEGDIFAVTLDKYADFRVAFEQAQILTKSLSQSFLLTSSVQRSGERVTAEEIRAMVGELEDGLGGVYSVFAQTLQYPLVKAKLAQLQRQNRLPSLPKEVQPLVTTGLQALGRGQDFNKLTLLLQTSNNTLGPETTAKYLNPSDGLRRLATSLSVDPKGLVRTEEEVQAAEQQAMASAMMEQAAAPVAGEIASATLNPQA